MKILFIGSLSKNKNDYLNYKILKKKNKVDTINIDNFFFFNKIGILFLYHLHFPILEKWFNYKFKKSIKKRYNLIWIENGEFFGENLLTELKNKGNNLIFFCNDNPFHNTDKSKWNIAKKALYLYDKIVFIYANRIKYAKRNNIKYSLIQPIISRQKFSKIKNLNFINRKYERDLIIIGTWFKERGIWAKKIIDAGINVEIFGQNWENDKNYHFFKKYIKKLNWINFNEYSKLIYTSKMALCLPNLENDDDITRKSFEIPLCGSLLLAKNTKSHRKIFNHKKDSILFNSPTDLIKNIKELLLNEKKILKLSKNGYKKIFLNKKFNSENNINEIIDKFN